MPTKYSPLRQNGDGLQSVYLAEISDGFADLLNSLLKQAGNGGDIGPVALTDAGADAARSTADKHIESTIQQSVSIGETEKEQLVKSRRGQGRFRENVRRFERQCRVSGVSDARFLIASHIKPWRSSSNQERLDGETGLLLAPNVDMLFDRGFISFDGDGGLLVSPVADQKVLGQLGVQVDQVGGVGTFTQGQQKYLGYHRREVFLESGRTS